jgi:hypothetical protein
MKLILITLVALVVGLMVGCSSAPVAPPPPAYSDAEVIGAVKGFLNGSGMADGCKYYARILPGMTINVRQDPSNRNKYLVTVPNSPEFSWTFISSLGKVISTSTGRPATYGC